MSPIPPKMIPATISPITAGCFSLSNRYPKTLANMRANAINKTTLNNSSSTAVIINLLRLQLLDDTA